MLGMNMIMKLLGILLAQFVWPALATGSNGVTAEMSPEKDVFVLVGGSFGMNCTVRAQHPPVTTSSPSYSTDQPSNITVLDPGSPSNITVRDPGTPSDITAPDPNSFLSVYNISITRRGTTLPKNLFTYHKKELTLQLNMENVTQKDSGLYSCYYDNKFMALKIVKVGEPPGKPNVTCLSDNFLDMTCLVKLSKNNGTIPYKWQLEYKTDSINITVPCNEVPRQSGVLSCHMKTEQEAFRDYTMYTVTVIGTPDPKKSLYGGNVTASIEVYTNFSIVKPAPVQALDIEVNNSTSAVVTWQYPHLQDPTNAYTLLQYEIQVRSEKGWDNRTLGFVHKAGDLKEALTLHDLVCNARYNVAVRSRPETAVGAIYWSNWSNATFNTSQTRPRQSTQISEGSYFVLDDQAEGKVNVVLYWKNPAEKDWCGRVEGYTVQWTHVSPSAMSVMEEASESARISYTALSDAIPGPRVNQVLASRLSDTGEYLLNMYTVNNVGESLVSSQLEFPSWKKARYVRVSWVSVEMSEGQPRVSWEMDSQYCGLVTEVTYYWCNPDLDKTMNLSYVPCKDNLDWITVPVDNACSSCHQWINRTWDMSSMRFAVSVIMTGMSGGMVWEKFRFKTYDAVPADPLYQVSPVQGDYTQLGLSVLFNNYYNVEEGGRPETIEIVYMASEDAQTCQQVYESPHAMKQSSAVNFSKPAVTVRELEPDTSYAVCARFTNAFGTGGFGKLLQGKTGSPETSTKFVPVFGMLGGIALLTGIVCFYRRFRRRVLRKSKVCVPEIPEIPEILDTSSRCTPKGSVLNLVTELKEQKPSGHDSGKGSDSPNSSCNLSQQECAEDGNHDPEIKENTPIPARANRRFSSTSCSSGLSGYLKVSAYGHTASEEDLLSCLDDEIGESNASFSPGSSNQVYHRKPRIYHKITSEDFSVNLNSQEPECDTEDEVDVAESLAGEKILEDYRMENVQQGGMYVGDTNKPVVGVVNGPYCPDSVLATAGAIEDRKLNSQILEKQETSAVPYSTIAQNESLAFTTGVSENDASRAEGNSLDPSVEALTETGKASEYIQATVIEKNVCGSEGAKIGEHAKKAESSTDSEVAAIESQINPSLLPVQIHGAKSLLTENVTDDTKRANVHISKDAKENTENVRDYKPEENTLPESPETDSNMSQSNILPNADEFAIDDSMDTFQPEFEPDSNIFSYQFDERIGSIGFDCYQDPDLMSLGQGSILSDVTDASKEDSRSIRSFSSVEKAGMTKQTQVPDTENSVLKMCNEINSEFVRTDMNGTESVKTGMQSNDVSETGDQVRDAVKAGKVILGEGSNKLECRDSVKIGSVIVGHSPDNKLGYRSDGDVNSYVKAGVDQS